MMIPHTPECQKAQRVREREIRYWELRWPDYCRHCRGWGGHTFHESHGFSYGPSEQLFEVCDSCVGQERCGRCGAEYYHDENPCPQCGWNYNDGLPEPYECYGECLPPEAA